jgi:hypothetical protein
MADSNEEIWDALQTSPLAKQAEDAICAYTRSQFSYRRPRGDGTFVSLPQLGFFRRICPPVPAGSPWWETGLPIYEIVTGIESQQQMLAAMTPRERWKYHDRQRRRDRRFACTRARIPRSPSHQAKVAASMVIVSNLVDQIRRAGSDFQRREYMLEFFVYEVVATTPTRSVPRWSDSHDSASDVPAGPALPHLEDRTGCDRRDGEADGLGER